MDKLLKINYEQIHNILRDDGDMNSRKYLKLIDEITDKAVE